MTIYVDLHQKTALDTLSKVTRVPTSEYVREAIDDLLVKYKKHLKRAGK